MTALITATAGLITALAMLVVAAFLHRLVKPISVAVLLIAEREPGVKSAHPLVRQLKDRLSRLLEDSGDL